MGSGWRGGVPSPPRGLDAEGKVEWYAKRVAQLERDLGEALQRVKKLRRSCELLRGDREMWQGMYHRLYDLEDPDLAAEMARRVARVVAGEARSHADRTLAEGEAAWNVEIASQYWHEDFEISSGSGLAEKRERGRERGAAPAPGERGC